MQCAMMLQVVFALQLRFRIPRFAFQPYGRCNILLNACFKAQVDISVENVSRYPEAPRIDHINKVESRVRDSGRRFLRHILPASCSLSVLWSNIMAIEFLQCSDVTLAMTVGQVCVLQNIPEYTRVSYLGTILS